MDTWIGDPSYPTDLKTEKPYVLYLWITYITTLCIQGIDSLRSIIRITPIFFFFYLFRTSTSFAYTFRNQLTMDLLRKEKRGKSETYQYVIKRTSGLWK